MSEPLPPTNFNAVADVVFQNALEHGFHHESALQTKPSVERMAIFLTNLTGEVSELWEVVRKGKLYEPCDKNPELTNAEEELADILIRTLDTAKTLGVDMDRAVRLKHEVNRKRAFKHGGKLALWVKRRRTSPRRHRR